jgi:hypothetical protein
VVGESSLLLGGEAGERVVVMMGWDDVARKVDGVFVRGVVAVMGPCRNCEAAAAAEDAAASSLDEGGVYWRAGEPMTEGIKTTLDAGRPLRPSD